MNNTTDYPTVQYFTMPEPAPEPEKTATEKFAEWRATWADIAKGNKPALENVLLLAELKAEAAALYGMIDELTEAFMVSYGADRYDYDLAAYWGTSPYDLGDGTYLKFELTDNVLALAAGKPVWKSVSFTPTSVNVQQLKRKPESLK